MTSATFETVTRSSSPRSATEAMRRCLRAATASCSTAFELGGRRSCGFQWGHGGPSSLVPV